MLLRIVRHFSRRNTGTKLLKKNEKCKFFLKKIHKTLEITILLNKQRHTKGISIMVFEMCFGEI